MGLGGMRGFAEMSNGAQLPFGGNGMMGPNVADSSSGAAYRDLSVSNAAGKEWAAASFVAGRSYTAFKVVLPLQKSALDPTFNLDVMIYTNASGAPGTLVGTGSSTVLASTLTIGYTNISFPNMSASIVAGTTYWIVLRASATGDATHLVYWKFPLGVNAQKVSANGTAWSSWDTDITMEFTIYK